MTEAEKVTAIKAVVASLEAGALYEVRNAIDAKLRTLVGDGLLNGGMPNGEFISRRGPERFQIDEEVWFMYQGRRFEGRVRKINLKTVGVSAPSHRSWDNRMVNWRVPPSMLFRKQVTG